MLLHAGSEGELYPSSGSIKSSDSVCTLESSILEVTDEVCEEDPSFCLPEEALSGSLSITEEILELLNQRGLQGDQGSEDKTESRGTERRSERESEEEEQQQPVCESRQLGNLGPCLSLEEPDDVFSCASEATTESVDPIKNPAPGRVSTEAPTCLPPFPCESSEEEEQKPGNRESPLLVLEELGQEGTALLCDVETSVHEKLLDPGPSNEPEIALLSAHPHTEVSELQDMAECQEVAQSEPAPQKNERSLKAKRDSTLTQDDRLLIERIKNYYEASEAGVSYLSKEDSISYIPTGVVKDSILRFNYILQQEVKKDREKSMCGSNGCPAEGKQVSSPRKPWSRMERECHQPAPLLETGSSINLSLDEEPEYKSCAEIRKAWKEKEKPNTPENSGALRKAKQRRKCLESQEDGLIIMEECDLEPVTLAPKVGSMNGGLRKEQKNHSMEERPTKLDTHLNREVTSKMDDTTESKANFYPAGLRLYEVEDSCCLIENSEKIINKVQLLAKMYSEKIGRMKTQRKSGDNRRLKVPRKATEENLPQILEEKTGERCVTEPHLYGHLLISETLLHINCVQENGLLLSPAREISGDLYREDKITESSSTPQLPSCEQTLAVEPPQDKHLISECQEPAHQTLVSHIPSDTAEKDSTLVHESNVVEIPSVLIHEANVVEIPSVLIHEANVVEIPSVLVHEANVAEIPSVLVHESKVAEIPPVTSGSFLEPSQISDCMSNSILETEEVCESADCLSEAREGLKTETDSENTEKKVFDLDIPLSSENSLQNPCPWAEHEDSQHDCSLSKEPELHSTNREEEMNNKIADELHMNVTDSPSTKSPPLEELPETQTAEEHVQIIFNEETERVDSRITTEVHEITKEQRLSNNIIGEEFTQVVNSSVKVPHFPDKEEIGPPSSEQVPENHLGSCAEENSPSSCPVGNQSEVQQVHRNRGISPSVLDVMQRLQLDSSFSIPSKGNENCSRKYNLATRSSSFKNKTSTAKEFQAMFQPMLRPPKEWAAESRATPQLLAPLALQRKLSSAATLSKYLSASHVGQSLTKRNPLAKSKSSDIVSQPQETYRKISCPAPASINPAVLTDAKPGTPHIAVHGENGKEDKPKQNIIKSTQTLSRKQGPQSPVSLSFACQERNLLDQESKQLEGPVCVSPGSAVLIAFPSPISKKPAPTSTASEPNSRVQSPLPLRTRMCSPPPRPVVSKSLRMPSFSSSRVCSFTPLSFNQLEKSSSSSANSTPTCTSPAALPLSPEPHSELHAFPLHTRRSWGNSFPTGRDRAVSPRSSLSSPLGSADEENQFWCTNGSPPCLSPDVHSIPSGISSHELTSIHWPDVRELRSKYGPLKVQKAPTPHKRADISSTAFLKPSKSLDEGAKRCPKRVASLDSAVPHTLVIKPQKNMSPCGSAEKWDSCDTKEKANLRASYSTTVNIQIGGSGRIASFSNAQVSLTHPLLHAPESQTVRKININGSTLEPFPKS
ncbi:uncharacterized protein WCC33_015177 [Rhinophrynus dorsalis]